LFALFPAQRNLQGHGPPCGPPLSSEHCLFHSQCARFSLKVSVPVCRRELDIACRFSDNGRRKLALLLIFLLPVFSPPPFLATCLVTFISAQPPFVPLCGGDFNPPITLWNPPLFIACIEEHASFYLNKPPGGPPPFLWAPFFRCCLLPPSPL